MKKRIKLNPTN